MILTHTHCDTCKSGAYGKLGCRMDYPHPRVDHTGPVQLVVETTHSKLTASDIFSKSSIDPPPQNCDQDIFSSPDPRILIWEQQRSFERDQMVVQQ